MKHLKLWESFKNNNIDGTLITNNDIIECIKKRGLIYSTIVKNLPDNDPEMGLTPVDIDDDGLITVEYDGDEYCVDIKDVKRIEF